MSEGKSIIVLPGEGGPDHPLAPGEQEWYALYVQVNHEKEVARKLEQKAICSFLPLLESWSKRQDRRKKVLLPLFTGYVFVHVLLDNHANLEIVKTPGALNILRNSEGPLSIPPYQIENLQTMIRYSHALLTHPYLQEGQWVRVVRGPLCGCIGILNRLDARRGRLVVSIDIIKKSVSVELDMEDVEPSDPPVFR